MTTQISQGSVVEEGAEMTPLLKRSKGGKRREVFGVPSNSKMFLIRVRGKNSGFATM